MASEWINWWNFFKKERKSFYFYELLPFANLTIENVIKISQKMLQLAAPNFAILYKIVCRLPDEIYKKNILFLRVIALCEFGHSKLVIK